MQAHRYITKFYEMEMQECIKQYPHTIADNKSLHYSQGFANTDAETADKPTGMRVLFSGDGKAERNMGMAPIPPPVRPFHTKAEFRTPK
jgi:hypothetical protein